MKIKTRKSEWLCRILIMVILIVGNAYVNLKTYSVYYGKYIPHRDGAEPEITMLIDNLWWVNTPSLKDIRYDMDGYRLIGSKKDLSQGQERRISNFSGEYSYTDENETTYYFDRKFHLKNIVDKDYNELKIDSVDEAAIKNDIQILVQPVLDEQGQPVVNLQWLFNIIYYKQFN